MRKGRKPGTKVFTVRSGVPGAPTLMLSADAGERGRLMRPSPTSHAKAAPLDMANLDTDQIIPKQFLKTVEREGLGKGLFYDLRFDGEGRPKPDFVLNDPRYAGAGVLIAGDNFGCGSSREHAPWALLDFGIALRDRAQLRRHLLQQLLPERPAARGAAGGRRCAR